MYLCTWIGGIIGYTEIRCLFCIKQLMADFPRNTMSNEAIL
jgi:hypothetical protein